MIEKNYLKTKPECKVKFALPIEQIEGAKKSSLLEILIIGTNLPRRCVSKNQAYFLLPSTWKKTNNISFVIWWMAQLGLMMKALTLMLRAQSATIKTAYYNCNYHAVYASLLKGSCYQDRGLFHVCRSSSHRIAFNSARIFFALWISKSLILCTMFLLNAHLIKNLPLTLG